MAPGVQVGPVLPPVDEVEALVVPALVEPPLVVPPPVDDPAPLEVAAEVELETVPLVVPAAEVTPPLEDPVSLPPFVTRPAGGVEEAHPAAKAATRGKNRVDMARQR